MKKRERIYILHTRRKREERGGEGRGGGRIECCTAKMVLQRLQ
jgi:hypothetical protein